MEGWIKTRSTPALYPPVTVKHTIVAVIMVTQTGFSIGFEVDVYSTLSRQLWQMDGL